MSITAHFDADTSAFRTEVQKAEEQLTLFEMSTEKTSTAIAGMGTVTTKTSSQFKTFNTSVSQFDGVLAAAGIHIGPAMKGLSDIAGAAGKTAGSFGLLGTAGLVLGTAMAAWKFGTMLHDVVQKFVDLDGAIAKAATALGLFADVGAAEAAAKADTLAAATQHLREMTGNAAATVTDYSQALKINNEWLADHKKKATEAAKATEEQAKAMETVRIAGQDNNAVLQTMSASTIAAAKAALDHGVSMGTVQTAYKLTASQIAAVEAAFKSEQDAAKASEQEHARITAELKTHWDAVLKIRDEALGKEAVEKATQWTEALFLLGGTVEKLSQTQLVDLKAVMGEAMTAMARNGELTAEQAQQFNDFALAAAKAETALRPVVTVTDDLVTAQAALVAEADAATAALIKQGDTAKAVAQGAADGWGLHPGGQAKTTGLVQRYQGGEMYLVNPQTGESVSRLERQYGAGGFLGWSLPGGAVNVTVDGNVLGSQDQLAKLIGDAVTSAYRSGGNRQPV